MGTQQVLLVILGVILVGVAIGVGIGMFNAQRVLMNRDSIISDLNELAAHAYAFRGRLRSMGGGQGDYSDYAIPAVLATNDNATYSIVDASQNSLTIVAVSAYDSLNTVEAVIDSTGKIPDWIYTGGFQ